MCCSQKVCFVSLFSLNWSLRSQAHFELAKIEEDIEQLDSARTNLLKVINTFRYISLQKNAA